MRTATIEQTDKPDSRYNNSAEYQLDMKFDGGTYRVYLNSLAESLQVAQTWVHTGIIAIDADSDDEITLLSTIH